MRRKRKTSDVVFSRAMITAQRLVVGAVTAQFEWHVPGRFERLSRVRARRHSSLGRLESARHKQHVIRSSRQCQLLIQIRSLSTVKCHMTQLREIIKRKRNVSR